MLMRVALLVSLWIGGVVAAGSASAATTVEVLETHPSGDHVTLGRNQTFSLRLRYSTDSQAGIWITPYYRGERVKAGTSPSQRYTGSGETIAWFFFIPPGDRVDEIRITAGDGGTKGTPVVATYRVNVTASQQPAAAEPPPAWVGELRERARAAQQREMEAYRAQPTSYGDMLLFAAFMLAVLTVGLGGMAAPVWLAFRWRGGWRAAIAVPAAISVFVVLRIAFDVIRDPTSHNLWPFEVLIAGAIGAVVTVVLLVCRRLLVRSADTSS